VRKVVNNLSDDDDDVTMIGRHQGRKLDARSYYYYESSESETSS